MDNLFLCLGVNISLKIGYQLKNYLSLIKFSHTIFAMPFAMLGLILGLLDAPTDDAWTLFILVALCMVFARSAAMAFNRWLDRGIDSSNPRTIIREIPAGIILPSSALRFVIVNSLLFIMTTYFINTLCFILSPVALLVILGYSFTKRFTALCHFVLGLGLALAPVGAYLAVTGQFGWIPVLVGSVVLFWVAGFDIIYALQDESFDKEHNLHSIPVALGRVGAMNTAKALHGLSAFLLILSVFLMDQKYPQSSFVLWSALVLFLLMLIYQHILIKPTDLSRVNMAFFTTNGVASLLFGTLAIIDLWF